jgi:starch synthase
MQDQTMKLLPLDPLKVLFTAAEADPFVKVGGLGDVAYALPQALRNLPAEYSRGRKIDVRLFLPFHSAIRKNGHDAQLLTEFEVPYPHGSIPAQAFYTEVNQLPVYLIAGNPIPPGAPVYTPDNYLDGLKYIFFSLACLALLEKLSWKIDIFHANDWHTAIAVYALSLLKENSPFFLTTKSVLTIHNLPFMGGGTEKALHDFGIPPSRDSHLPIWARYQPLPMGISTADQTIAVSPSYASEIQTPEFGCGLEEYIRTKKTPTTGIINGLDAENWDPRTDTQIPANFDENQLDLRSENKKFLLKEFQLPEDTRKPLIIMVGRMDPQKGIDLALSALKMLSEFPWTAVFLGTGNSSIESDVRQLEEEFPERFRAIMRFDARLSRIMYAGADMILMPSRYEPCGLAQMIAMRYGCVPVARATGGLRDTIQDVSNSQTPSGYLFENPTADELAEVLKKALLSYSALDGWRQIQKNGMRMDFSWLQSAREYANIYMKLTGMEL